MSFRREPLWPSMIAPGFSYLVTLVPITIPCSEHLPLALPIFDAHSQTSILVTADRLYRTIRKSCLFLRLLIALTADRPWPTWFSCNIATLW